MSVGSVLTRSGLITLAMMISISSPFPEAEPMPVIPSSVSTRTKVVDRVLRTPERLKTWPSAGIGARRRIVWTSVIFIWRLLHLPKLPFDDFAVDDDKIDFFIQSLVAFGIDSHDFRFVALLGIHPEQRQRRVAGAGEIVVMILR